MARGLTSYRSPILGTTHMVSAGHYLAAAAGYRILEDGGNAIDAGVASGIAINVTLPHATNFGGVAPIAIYDAASDDVVTISGLGRWPRAANIDYFNKHAGGQIPTGILRTVMPAAADAWLTALEKYGTMTFEHVVTPALELAENGFPVSAYLHDGLQTTEEDHEGGVAMWPSTQEVYLPKGRTPRTGELLVQADLGRTFRRLIEAESGAAHLGREAAIRAAHDRFYRGDIAEEMAAFSEEQGGLVTLQDLAEFSVKVEPPAAGRFRDYTIYTCGPWCQGPVVAQTLQMLEDDDLSALGHNSTEYIHLVSQALNLAYSTLAATPTTATPITSTFRSRACCRRATLARGERTSTRRRFPRCRLQAIPGRTRTTLARLRLRSAQPRRPGAGCRTPAMSARSTGGATRSPQPPATRSRAAR